MVTESGQLRLPSTWGPCRVKSSVRLVALDRRRDPQADVALLAPRVVLEHVLGLVGAVGKLGERGPGAALRVVEDLRHPGAQQVDAVALGELEQAPLADQVGGSLGAQVGKPLARVAHLARPGAPARSSSARVGGITTPSSSSRVEPAGIPAGVGPPTSAWWARLAAKPSSSPAGEDRRDQGDVGQVGAAPVGVVEDPEVARALLLARAPRRPRRASSRGGPGCARPASPARRRRRRARSSSRGAP